ncbi:MAG: hypothetical protein JWR19_2227 [Pedosphaera sp.]|nr:hypothetical protein [Pedosphaera sp.]
MSLQQRVCKTLGILGLVVTMPSLVLAQSGYVTQAGEYAPVGNIPGDQAYPSLSITNSGGFIVWQDNITDGNGLGISAMRLDSNFSPMQSSFRVNQLGTDDQERPQVTLLRGGGAAFVWQGGKQGFQHIYARFLTASNTWFTNEFQVGSSTNYQVKPAIATLANGNVIVTWSSFKQDNADGLQGVYGQLLSTNGVKIGGEFPVNQFTSYNQRDPAVAALSSGNFAITWVSEQERTTNNVDIYARIYNASAVPLSNEILANTSTNICASPAIAGAADGSFMIGWSEKDVVVVNNSWDVYARRFSGTGVGGAVQRVNTQRYGDQFSPKLSSIGVDYLAVWTSLGQDGSREGVYGQFLHGDASLSGTEFRVNTTVLNQQMFPAVAADGVGRFLAVWSSYQGLANVLDLNAQRFVTFTQPLAAPGAPIVSALDSFTLVANWPPVAGFSVDHFELYLDGAGTPFLVTNTYWQNDDTFSFNPGSTHTFQLAYVLTDGRHSPLSATTTAKLWAADRNGDGLPDDWETLYWGTNKVNWPSANTPLTPGGPTALTVLHWGANPLDPNTWLRTSLDQTPQGLFLSWNTQPGGTYQVQVTTDLVNWTDVGASRFAAGTTDSVYLGATTQGYYRIKRLVYVY